MFSTSFLPKKLKQEQQLSLAQIPQNELFEKSTLLCMRQL
jgi:hypothetical protein